MADVTIKPQQIYKSIFSPARKEPPGNPGMYHFLRWLVAFQGGLIAVLIGFAVLTSFVFGDTYVYHLVVLDRSAFPKQVKTLLPLDEPNLTRTAIVNMAMHVATQVQSYGFHNADERLLKARRLFTDEAWQSFALAHLQPGRLDRFKENRQILSTIATKGAVIVKEGVEGGRYRWVVEMPIISSYLAGSDDAPRNALLRITFVRAPTSEFPEGVAIDGWKEKGGGSS
jgi:hypothetical protein